MAPPKPRSMTTRILDVRTHMAYINPDVAMGEIAQRNTHTSQLFTVFGEAPHTKIDTTEEGEYFVVMEGVDVYNPVDNMVTSEVERPGGGLVHRLRLRRQNLLHHSKPSFPTRKHGAKSPVPSKASLTRIGSRVSAARPRCRFPQANIGVLLSRSSTPAGTRSCGFTTSASRGIDVEV